MLAIRKLLVDNFKMTIRNKQALVWAFVLPIILIVLFGLAFGKKQTFNFKIGVIDKANNKYSEKFIDGLENIDSFKLTKNQTKEKQLKAIKAGNRNLVIVIPATFGDNIEKIVEAKKKAVEAAKAAQKAAIAQQKQQAAAAAASQSATTSATTSQTAPGAPSQTTAAQSATAAQSSSQKKVAPTELKIPKVTPSEIKVYYDAADRNYSDTARSILKQVIMVMNQKSSQSPTFYKTVDEGISTRKMSNIDFFAAGILAMFTMNGGVIAVVMIIVGYREQGILRRLKATPLSIITFLGTNIIIRVIIALIQMFILLAIAIYAFDAHIIGSIWLLSLIVIEGSLVFIALGFAIASYSRSNQTAQAVANIVTMPMMFLSGVFFPTDSFPKFVQPIIKALPLTYLADAYRQVMMRGAGFDVVAKDMGILAIYGVVIFTLGVIGFKWE